MVEKDDPTHVWTYITETADQIAGHRILFTNLLYVRREQLGGL